jgi:hypothetical protein
LSAKISASTRTKKSFTEKIRLVVLIIVVSAVIIPAAILGPYALRVQRFGADPASGYYADFYLYVSPTAKGVARDSGEVTILVQPNNSKFG